MEVMAFNKFATFHLWLLLILGCCGDSASQEYRCLWTGRSSTSKEPTVVKMRTECTRGKIEWNKPFGGLRATFLPKNIAKIKKKGFKVCFKTAFTGVNIYSEGYKSLTLLKSAKDKKVGEILCIPSLGKPVVLYLETLEARKDIVNIAYSVHYQQKRIKQRPSKECKPCGYFKLLESLCTSDFVVKGRIISTIQINEHTIQADILAKDLLRQTGNIFTKQKRRKYSSPIGAVQFPAGCRWNRNKSYLYTGRIVSGRGPVLGCHIREKVWMKLQKKHIQHLCKYVYGVPKISNKTKH